MNSMSLDDLASSTMESAFKLFTGQFLGTLIAGIGSIILTRLLGPEAYGKYALSTVVPSLLLVFAGLGIDSGITRYTAINTGCRLRGYMKAGLFFKILTALPLTVFSFLSAELLTQLILGRSDIAPLVKVASFIVLFSSVLSSLTAIFVGIGMSGRAGLLNIVFQTSRSILSPLLVLIGLGVLGAVAGYVSGFIFASLIGLLILLSVARRYSTDCSEDERIAPYLRELLVFSVPIFTSTLVSTLLSTYQSALLSRYASYLEIGNFQAASNLASLLTLVTLPISTSLFPAFSKFRDPREASNAVDVAVTMTALLLTPVTLFTVVEARDIVRIFYGASYMASSEYLSMYILIYLYSLIGSIVWGSFFQGIGKPKVVFMSTLVYSAIYVPLAFFLASTQSIKGVIVAVLLASLSSNAMLLWESKKVGVKIDFSKKGKILLSALMPIPIIMCINLPPTHALIRVTLLGAIYLSLYVLLSSLLGAVTHREIELVRSTLRIPQFLRRIIELFLDILERIIVAKESLRGNLFLRRGSPATS
jgi:O-antigen/teichoic acid export membrane protein